MQELNSRYAKILPKIAMHDDDELPQTKLMCIFPVPFCGGIISFSEIQLWMMYIFGQKLSHYTWSVFMLMAQNISINPKKSLLQNYCCVFEQFLSELIKIFISSSHLSLIQFVLVDLRKFVAPRQRNRKHQRYCKKKINNLNILMKGNEVK